MTKRSEFKVTGLHSIIHLRAKGMILTDIPHIWKRSVRTVHGSFYKIHLPMVRCAHQGVEENLQQLHHKQ